MFNGQLDSIPIRAFSGVPEFDRRCTRPSPSPGDYVR